MTSVVNPNARSTYQRYGKSPYQYSAQFHALERARKAGDHFEAERLARQHSAAHGLRVRFALSEIKNEEDV